MNHTSQTKLSLRHLFLVAFYLFSLFRCSIRQLIVDDFALFLFSPIIASCLTKGRRKPDLTPPKNFATPPSTLLLPRFFFFCFYGGAVYRFPRFDAPGSERVYPHAREPSRGIIKCAGCVVRPFVSLLFLYAHSFRARRMCRSVCCDGGAVRRINTLSVPSGDHVTHPPTHLQFLLFFSGLRQSRRASFLCRGEMPGRVRHAVRFEAGRYRVAASTPTQPSDVTSTRR